MALLAGVFVVGPWLLQRAPTLQERPEYQIQRSKIRLAQALPPHVPSDLLERVLRTSDLPETMSLVDPNVATRVAESLARSPWVETVERVVVSRTDGVVAEIQTREPMAIVNLRTGDVLVDRAGVVLPLADLPASQTGLLPRIRLHGANLPPAAGRAWDDSLVVGAAKLAAELKPKWTAWRLAAVLVPARTKASVRASDAVYELEAAGGSRIVWGAAPGIQRAGELTVEQKLARLDHYSRAHGFATNGGPYEIDIRPWNEIARKRMPSSSRVVEKPAKSKSR